MRHVNAERLGGLEVYDEVKLCRLQDRKIAGFLPLENSRNVDTNLQPTNTDLIRQARALRPGLPALLISGFADLQNARHDPIPEGVPFLPKPFDLVDLLAQVRALLGS